MRFHPRDGEVIGLRAQLVELVGGRWCVTAGGIQHGGNRDAAGAGDLTFPTVEAAEAYAREIEGENPAPGLDSEYF